MEVSAAAFGNLRFRDDPIRLSLFMDIDSDLDSIGDRIFLDEKLIDHLNASCIILVNQSILLQLLGQILPQFKEKMVLIQDVFGMTAEELIQVTQGLTYDEDDDAIDSDEFVEAIVEAIQSHILDRALFAPWCKYISDLKNNNS